MAAGSASGRNSGSSPALESTLDRRFQTVNNTMESIQGLSVWCIENKKYSSVIVRYWMKWMRKSDASHRLNLFYLANDVIQNCKRKNAIVYRTTFTDVLLEAIKLISAMKDSKVSKSVARILNIWEERAVYSEDFIHQLKNGLVQIEEPVKAPPAPAASDSSRAALKSKIVAEFVPSTFIEHLSSYRRSMDEIDLKEKQLAAMRVDVCSTDALKKLKDKAGGKRFSKDFEDGSTKLQDFVSFLDGEVKKGPPLMEALENADIFYEMQYKEVKIVAKAYETFANRVSHLKRKLDALKAVLPDPNDSPIPSPIIDAPSPTGSESPFHSLGEIASPDPELDGQEMDDDLIDLADAPSPLSSVGGSPKPSSPLGDADNRDVEDMELSDVEETETPAIIVEQSVDPIVVSKESSVPQNVTETLQANPVAQTKQVTTPATPVPTATQALPVNLAGVDLGKISSILSTLTNVMKSTGAVGVSPVSRSSPSVPSTPSSAVKTPTTPAPPANPLANILSKVDFNPSTLLSVLSKTQPQGGLQGLSSLISTQAAKTPASSTLDSDKAPQTPPLAALAHASPPVIPTPATVQLSRDPVSQGPMAPKFSQPDMLIEKVNPNTPLNTTLDSKIDNFLHGNPALKGFNMGFPSVLTWPKATVDSPLASTENLVGTPVRDEGGSTPTQDEIMDGPRPDQSGYQHGQSVPTDAKSTHPTTPWQEPNPHAIPMLPSGTEIHQKTGQARNDFRSSVPSLAEAEAKRNQLIDEILSSSKSSNQHPSGNVGKSLTGPGPAHQDPRKNPEPAKGGMYLDTYRDGQEQQREPYKINEPHNQDLAAPSFFTTPLPPIPNLPPPPQDFVPSASPSMPSGPHIPREESFREAAGGDESYTQENPAYEEPYRPYGDGPSHFAPEPHHHSNIQVDFNHQHPPRVPMQHPPPMPHHQTGSPPPEWGYHEGVSPPRPVPEDPYFDPYYDHPPRSPSPPHYEMHPVSPHTHEYFPEDIPPHTYPMRRGPPHIEHRPRLPPQHVRPPHPGHYPPPRPLRHPPPVPYGREPPFPRGKRPGPPFARPPRGGGPYFPPKRPFLPPHY